MLYGADRETGSKEYSLRASVRALAITSFKRHDTSFIDILRHGAAIRPPSFEDGRGSETLVLSRLRAACSTTSDIFLKRYSHATHSLGALDGLRGDLEQFQPESCIDPGVRSTGYASISATPTSRQL